MLTHTLRRTHAECDRMLGLRAVVLLVVALGGGSRVDGQLLAGVKQFLGTLPTFYSVDRSAAPRPAATGPSGTPDVNLLAVATNATALMDRHASCAGGASCAQEVLVVCVQDTAWSSLEALQAAMLHGRARPHCACHVAAAAQVNLCPV